MLSSAEIQCLQFLVDSQASFGYGYYYAVENIYSNSSSIERPDFTVHFSNKPFSVSSVLKADSDSSSFSLDVYTSSRSSSRDSPRIVRSSFSPVNLSLHDWSYSNCETVQSIGYALPNVALGGVNSYESNYQTASVFFLGFLAVSLFAYAVFGFFRR